jgi:hypothetical protein
MSDGDLVKRLMGYADRVSSGVNETCAEAADRITALTEENAALALQVQRARDGALEEAARVVNRYFSFPPPTSKPARYHEVHVVKPNIAAAIRALRCATEGAGG